MIKDYQTGYYFDKISNRAIRKKQAINFDDMFYQKYNNLTLDEYAFGEHLKNANTIGCCHFYALLLAKCTPNSILSVGELKTLESSVRDEYLEPFEHSWVEVGDFVLDTTSKQIYNKDYYYKAFKPQVYKKYSQKDLHDEKTFLLHLYWSLKNREFLLENIFKNNFKNKYNIYKNDKEFIKKINSIKNKYDILIDAFDNEDILEK